MKPVIAACALLALIEALLLSRAPGPGVSPDAASYLCATEFLAHGQAPRIPFAEWDERDSTSPLRHFPPGFPAVAALPAALGAPLLQAARWVESLAFAATAGLVAFAAGSVAGPAAAALAGVMVMSTPAIAETHSLVLSEPLFFALLAALLAAMARAPERALLLGSIAAAAVLVRYAGVSLVAAAVLCTLLAPGDLRQRLRRACIAAVPPLLALGAWRWWAGTFRSYGYKSGTSSQFGEAWDTTAAWIVPVLEASWLRSAVACAALVAIVLACGALKAPAASGLRRASLLIVLCYAGVVVGSRVFADPDIPFDWRLLAPLALVIETCLAAVLVATARSWSSAARYASTAAVALWLIGGSSAIVRYALTPGRTPEAAAPQLARWLRDEGSAYTLYSNDPTRIWHLAHRSSRLLPRTDDEATLQRFSEELARRPSAVVGFRSALMDNIVLPASVAEHSALGAPARFDQASVWLVPSGLALEELTPRPGARP